MKEEKLTAFIVENQVRFYRLAYSYLKNREEALDAVQTAVCRALEKQDGLQDADALRTWFYRILTRTAWAYCKKQKKEQPVEEIYDVYQASLPLEKSSLEIVAENEYQSNLLAAINRLNPKQRIVVILYYYDEFSVEEIAKATQTLPGTVKSRLFTARHNLQKLLQTKDFVDGEVVQYEK